MRHLDSFGMSCKVADLGVLVVCLAFFLLGPARAGANRICAARDVRGSCPTRPESRLYDGE